MLVLVSKWCTTKIKVREKTKHTMCPRLGSLEEVQIPLLDDQRHCDTVLSTKTFFKKLSNFVDYKTFL